MSLGSKNFYRIEKKNFYIIFDYLNANGYRIIGPKIGNGAIVYSEISDPGELPKGWIDIQDGGSYRLERDGDAYFGHGVGPVSPKRLLFPPEIGVWSAEKKGRGFEISPADEEYPKTALLGIRPCELAAIGIQDRIFSEALPCFR